MTTLTDLIAHLEKIKILKAEAVKKGEFEMAASLRDAENQLLKLIDTKRADE